MKTLTGEKIKKNPIVDRTGKRYGRLFVKSYVGINEYKQHLWTCKCDCGIEDTYTNKYIGSVTEVGFCCRFNKKSPKKYSLIKEKLPLNDRTNQIFKQLYYAVGQRHKKMSGDILEFNLFKKLSSTNCYYCDTEPSRVAKEKRVNGSRKTDTEINVNGIDRLNSSIGYTKKNSVSCCSSCNWAKHELGEDEFYQWVDKIYNNLKKTNRI